jgi:hypothetical protein
LKIPFHKIRGESDFVLDLNEENNFSIKAKFTLKQKEYNLLHSLLKIEGSINSICNTCSDDIILEISEEIEFLISNGIYKGSHSEFDVIEAVDGEIDFNSILESEIELIRDDSYKKCDSCKDKEVNLEF